MLFFGIGFAIGILLGIYAKRQGIRERDEEIERLRNVIKNNQIQTNNLNMNMSMMMNQTSYDNNKDNLKLNNLEMLVNNYGQTLMAIKQQHENQSAFS